MPAHILAASLPIRKNMAEKLKVHHVETNKYAVVCTSDFQSPPCHTTVQEGLPNNQQATSTQPPAFCLPLQELNVLVNGSIKVPTILDTGSQIIVIRHNLI